MAASAFLKQLQKSLSGAFVLSFRDKFAGQQAAYALDDALGRVGLVPVGTILPWFGYGVVTLPAGFQLCDGSPISDADSPLNGKNTPALNTATTDPIFLGGYSAPGTDPVAAIVAANLPSHSHLARGLQGGITGTLDVRGTNALAGTGTTIAVLNGGGVSEGVTTGSTSGPNIGDGTTNNFPHHMKVTYIIRIK